MPIRSTTYGMSVNANEMNKLKVVSIWKASFLWYTLRHNANISANLIRQKGKKCRNDDDGGDGDDVMLTFK